MQRKQALEGIKVLDFTTSMAGPQVTKCFADFGATVFKVESITHPDVTRVSTVYKDNIPGVNRSGLFLQSSSSKYSLCLNLNTPQGVKIAEKLVAWADVVAESFSPGVMQRWGLTYERLKQIKPDVVMLSSSLQGQTGTAATYSGWGHTMQGLAGFIHLTGWPDREAVGFPYPVTDFIQPWFGTIAVLTALDYRCRTGKGQYIDLSQLEASMQFLAPALLDYFVNQRVQHAMGNRSGFAAPHAAFRCRGDDRWCAIAVFTDQEWESFCKVIGNPEWTKESRFSTLLGRKKNEDELERLVEEWTINHSAEEVMVDLQAAGVAAGVVQSAEDLLERDPQMRHRHYFEVLNHSELGACIHHAWSIHLSRTPWQLRPAPCLGEHTEYICREVLGLPDEEFVKLFAEGVLE